MVIVNWIVDLFYSGYLISGVRVKYCTFGMADVISGVKLWVVL